MDKFLGFPHYSHGKLGSCRLGSVGWVVVGRVVVGWVVVGWVGCCLSLSLFKVKMLFVALAVQGVCVG